MKKYWNLQKKIRDFLNQIYLCKTRDIMKEKEGGSYGKRPRQWHLFDNEIHIR